MFGQGDLRPNAKNAKAGVRVPALSASSAGTFLSAPNYEAADSLTTQPLTLEWAFPSWRRSGLLHSGETNPVHSGETNPGNPDEDYA
jgi:hypothetical protein